MGRIRKILSSVNFRLYIVLIVLFVNALISVAVAGNLYLNRTKVSLAKAHKGAMIVTDRGIIEIAFNKKTPMASKNFIGLTESGFYNGLRIHRIVPKVLIEMGDPLTRSDELKSKWGNGGPGYVFSDEIFPDDVMEKGVVAMVNNGPNTNGSQFFILSEDSTWLNGQHTILGWVTKGQGIVDSISSSPVSILGIPENDIVIKEVILK